MTRLTKAQRALKSALRRLDNDQGRVARRNARTAVKAALKRVQSAVDAEYPVIRKPVASRKPRVARHDLTGKARRLRSKKLVLVREISPELARVMSAESTRAEQDPKLRGYWVHPRVSEVIVLADEWAIMPGVLIDIPWKSVARSAPAHRLARALVYVLAARQSLHPTLIARLKRDSKIAAAIVAMGQTCENTKELRAGLDLLGVMA